MSRYARQMVLPEVGAAGQARLTAAHVLVVGAGGLGCPVLHYLAGAGVGRITVIDGDRVSEDNLHRQPLFGMDQLGLSKALAAASALAALNPHVQVTSLTEWLDPACAPELVDAADLVIDCADTFAASLTLSDHCRDTGTPLITASALALSGYVAGCCATAPSLRAIFPDLPAGGQTCATAGVMGPVVGTIGALQAQMALSVLLGLEPSPLGQLVSFNAANWHMGGFRFDTAPEPARPLPFLARSQIGDRDLVIDLRTQAPPFSAQARHIAPEAMATLAVPGAQRVVLACSTGLRAHNVGQQLQTRWPGEIALLALNE